MIQAKSKKVNNPAIDNFLKRRPLPAEIAHLEPSLRKLPNVEMLVDLVLGATEYNLGNADFDRLVTEVGAMYDQPSQRCAGCLMWVPQFHAISVGTTDNFTVVAMCQQCTERFESGRATPQMHRNLASYSETDGVQ